MKKIVYLMLLGCLMLVLNGCSEEPQEQIGTVVFFTDGSGTKLIEEPYHPKETKKKALAAELLERLEGPASSLEFRTTKPEKVQVLGYYLNDKCLEVKFNNAYLEMDPVTEVMMRAAYVKTLVQIPDVDGVKFYIEEQTLLNSAGKEVGVMNASTFIDTRGQGINSYQYAVLSLYFADSSGDKIVKEMRNVHYSSNTSLEKIVVDQLVKGPVNTNLRAVMPGGVQVLDVSVKQRICTVNLDKTWNQGISDSNVTPETALYALVNSLCELDNIKGVRILVDGIQEVMFCEKVDLNQTFEWNPNVIASSNGVKAIEQQSEASTGTAEPDVGIDSVLKDKEDSKKKEEEKSE